MTEKEKKYEKEIAKLLELLPGAEELFAHPAALVLSDGGFVWRHYIKDPEFVSKLMSWKSLDDFHLEFRESQKVELFVGKIPPDLEATYFKYGVVVHSFPDLTLAKATPEMLRKQANSSVECKESVFNLPLRTGGERKVEEWLVCSANSFPKGKICDALAGKEYVGDDLTRVLKARHCAWALLHRKDDETVSELSDRVLGKGHRSQFYGLAGLGLIQLSLASRGATEAELLQLTSPVKAKFLSFVPQSDKLAVFRRILATGDFTQKGVHKFCECLVKEHNDGCDAGQRIVFPSFSVGGVPPVSLRLSTAVRNKIAKQTGALGLSQTEYIERTILGAEQPDALSESQRKNLVEIENALGLLSAEIPNLALNCGYQSVVAKLKKLLASGGTPK